MLVRDRQNKPAPRGMNYAFTIFQGVIHLTYNGRVTNCGYDVHTVLTNQQALDSDKNICHGCFPQGK